MLLAAQAMIPALALPLGPALAFAVPQAQAPCPFALPDGVAVAGGFSPRYAHPTFTVRNRQEHPIFVRMDRRDGGDRNVFYIGPRAQAVIRFVPVGEYDVSVAANGRLGGDCSTLASADYVFRFAEPFDFYRRETGGDSERMGIELGDQWIEIGNEDRKDASSVDITLEAFNR